MTEVKEEFMKNESQINNIMDQIDKSKNELINILIDTIKIPSINPSYDGVDQEKVIGNETLVNKYYKEVLDGLGLKTDLWEETQNRANLVGICKGSGNGRSLAFNGHVDVVPAGEKNKWTIAPPWEGSVIDEKVYGRGACDMKGGNAAVILALKSIIESGYQPKGDVILQFVVGEESQEKDYGTSGCSKTGLPRRCRYCCRAFVSTISLGYLDCFTRGTDFKD